MAFKKVFLTLVLISLQNACHLPGMTSGAGGLHDYPKNPYWDAKPYGLLTNEQRKALVEEIKNRNNNNVPISLEMRLIMFLELCQEKTVEEQEQMAKEICSSLDKCNIKDGKNILDQDFGFYVTKNSGSYNLNRSNKKTSFSHVISSSKCHHLKKIVDDFTNKMKREIAAEDKDAEIAAKAAHKKWQQKEQDTSDDIFRKNTK